MSKGELFKEIFSRVPGLSSEPAEVTKDRATIHPSKRLIHRKSSGSAARGTPVGATKRSRPRRLYPGGFIRGVPTPAEKESLAAAQQREMEERHSRLEALLTVASAPTARRADDEDEVVSVSSDGSSNVENVIALWGFIAQTPKQRNLVKGEVFEMVEQPNSSIDQWTKVQRDGIEGYVPSSYIRPVQGL